MARIRLRRGLLARLRPMGPGSLLSWLVLGVSVWAIASGTADDDLGVAGAAVALTVLCRVLIAAEYAHADPTALAWRSLVASNHHAWHEVQLVELDAWNLAVYRHATAPVPCIRVHLRNGNSYWVHASLGCSMDAIGEFIAGARTLSAYDWGVPGTSIDFVPSGRRSGSGSRVGLPSAAAVDRRRGLRRRN